MIIETTTEKVKNYALILMFLGVCILSLLLFKSCDNDSEVDAVIAKNKIDGLEKQIAAEKSKQLEAEKLKEVFQDSVKQLKKEKEAILANIPIVREKAEKKLIEVKSYDTKAYSDYYKSRYVGFEKEFAVDGNKLTVTDTANNAIVNDLVMGDVAKAEVKIYKSALEKEEKISTTKDSINGQNEKIIGSLESVVKLQNEEKNVLGELVDAQAKTIRKGDVKQKILVGTLGAVIILEVIKAIIPKK